MYLRADFNAVRDENLIVASLRFAVPAFGPMALEPGDWIRVEDGEGNSCWGVIESIEPPLVRVRLDWVTWRSADAVRFPDKTAGVPAHRLGFVVRCTRSDSAVYSRGDSDLVQTLTTSTKGA
jgi:hypothetical protein